MMISTGMVYIHLYKLSLVTISSSQYEWTLLCNTITIAEWVKYMLLSFDRKAELIRVKQDSTSVTISLSFNHSNFARTKFFC